MSKGHAKGNKEAKKPKSDTPKAEASAYKRSMGKGESVNQMQGKKK